MKNILFLSVLLFMTSNSATGQTYTIDPGHTAITSKVVRFGVVPVLGRFNDVTGEITYNPEQSDQTEASIIIKTDSYVANNPDGEKAVKSEAFLNTAAFPEMAFEVTGLKKTDDGYVTTGTLTLHGVTKEVHFPVSITGPMIDLPTRKQSIGITGSLNINRLDYGVGSEMKLPSGTEIIGNEVVIEFYVLAIED